MNRWFEKAKPRLRCGAAVSELAGRGLRLGFPLRRGHRLRRSPKRSPPMRFAWTAKTRTGRRAALVGPSPFAVAPVDSRVDLRVFRPGAGPSSCVSTRAFPPPMSFGATPEFSRSGQPRYVNPGPGLRRCGPCTDPTGHDPASRPSSALPSAPEGASGPTPPTRGCAVPMHTPSRRRVRRRGPRRSGDQRKGSTRRSRRPRTSPFGDAEQRPEGRAARSREAPKRLVDAKAPSRTPWPPRRPATDLSRGRPKSVPRQTRDRRAPAAPPKWRAHSSTPAFQLPPRTRLGRPKTTDNARGDVPRLCDCVPGTEAPGRPAPRKVPPRPARSIRRSGKTGDTPSALRRGPTPPPEGALVGRAPKNPHSACHDRSAETSRSLRASRARHQTASGPMWHARNQPLIEPRHPPEGQRRVAPSPFTEVSDAGASSSSSHPKMRPVHAADPKVGAACASRSRSSSGTVRVETRRSRDPEGSLERASRAPDRSARRRTRRSVRALREPRLARRCPPTRLHRVTRRPPEGLLRCRPSPKTRLAASRARRPVRLAPEPEDPCTAPWRPKHLAFLGARTRLVQLALRTTPGFGRARELGFTGRGQDLADHLASANARSTVDRVLEPAWKPHRPRRPARPPSASTTHSVTSHARKPAGSPVAHGPLPVTRWPEGPRGTRCVRPASGHHRGPKTAWSPSPCGASGALRGPKTPRITFRVRRFGSPTRPKPVQPPSASALSGPGPVRRPARSPSTSRHPGDRPDPKVRLVAFIDPTRLAAHLQTRRPGVTTEQRPTCSDTGPTRRSARLLVVSGHLANPKAARLLVALGTPPVRSPARGPSRHLPRAVRFKPPPSPKTREPPSASGTSGHRSDRGPSSRLSRPARRAPVGPESAQPPSASAVPGHRAAPKSRSVAVSLEPLPETARTRRSIWPPSATRRVWLPLRTRRSGRDHRITSNVLGPPRRPEGPLGCWSHRASRAHRPEGLLTPSACGPPPAALEVRRPLRPLSACGPPPAALEVRRPLRPLSASGASSRVRNRSSSSCRPLRHIRPPTGPRSACHRLRPRHPVTSKSEDPFASVHLRRAWSPRSPKTRRCPCTSAAPGHVEVRRPVRFRAPPPCLVTSESEDSSVPVHLRRAWSLRSPKTRRCPCTSAAVIVGPTRRSARRPWRPPRPVAGLARRPARCLLRRGGSRVRPNPRVRQGTIATSTLPAATRTRRSWLSTFHVCVASGTVRARELVQPPATPRCLPRPREPEGSSGRSDTSTRLAAARTRRSAATTSRIATRRSRQTRRSVGRLGAAPPRKPVRTRRPVWSSSSPRRVSRPRQIRRSVAAAVASTRWLPPRPRRPGAATDHVLGPLGTSRDRSLGWYRSRRRFQLSLRPRRSGVTTNHVSAALGHPHVCSTPSTRRPWLPNRRVGCAGPESLTLTDRTNAPSGHPVPKVWCGHRSRSDAPETAPTRRSARSPGVPATPVSVGTRRSVPAPSSARRVRRRHEPEGPRAVARVNQLPPQAREPGMTAVHVFDTSGAGRRPEGPCRLRSRRRSQLPPRIRGLGVTTVHVRDPSGTARVRGPARRPPRRRERPGARRPSGRRRRRVGRPRRTRGLVAFTVRVAASDRPRRPEGPRDRLRRLRPFAPVRVRRPSSGSVPLA